MITSLLTQFVLAVFATLGFAVIFRVPKRDIAACIITGGLGWVAYSIAFGYMDSPVLGCFVGACIVGLLSIIFAKVLKDATTVFVIPGILCLVPGSHIYRTMAALIDHDLEEFANVGLQTLFMAGAIAIGLLVMGALGRLIRQLVKTTVSIKDRF